MVLYPADIFTFALLDWSTSSTYKLSCGITWMLATCQAGNVCLGAENLPIFCKQSLSLETSNGPHKAATVTALKPYINLAVHSEHCLINCHFFKLVSPHQALNPYLTSSFKPVNLQRVASVQCCHGQLHIYPSQLSASEILGRLSHSKLPMSIAINPPTIKQNRPPVLNNHHFLF